MKCEVKTGGEPEDFPLAALGFTRWGILTRVDNQDWGSIAPGDAVLRVDETFYVACVNGRQEWNPRRDGTLANVRFRPLKAGESVTFTA